MTATLPAAGAATKPVAPHSFLLITLDACRYDTMAAADAPHIKAVGPLHKAYSPGTFTYTSHLAMFMGFTPGVPGVREPYLNPKWGRIFRMQATTEGGGAVAPFTELSGHNVIDGLKNRGYLTIGTGAVNWFDPNLATSAALTKDFDRFFYPGDIWSLERQLKFVESTLDEAHGPVLVFMNIGETHSPYFYKGAPWKRLPNPCRPFGDENDADECRRRQLGCLEWVDGQLAPLLARFADANVIICADHGEAWGEDGLWNHGIHHWSVLEVPLLYRLVHSPNDYRPPLSTRSQERLHVVSTGARMALKHARRRVSAR